jgi:hypothetical protein
LRRIGTRQFLAQAQRDRLLAPPDILPPREIFIPLAFSEDGMVGPSRFQQLEAVLTSLSVSIRLSITSFWFFINESHFASLLPAGQQPTQLSVALHLLNETRRAHG